MRKKASRLYPWPQRVLTVACVALGMAFVSARTASAQAPSFTRAFVIVMENHEFDDIIGNPDAPFINALAEQGALGTAYTAVTHPSLPNYMALTGGDTVFTDDCVGCTTGTGNLADLLEAAGHTWRAYMEDMPSPCGTDDTGLYATRHNPFIHYDDIVSNAARCQANVVPLSQLSDDLANGNVADFVWITPNLCSDMHDCDVATGDAWLATLIPQITSSPAFENAVLFLVWDEGTTDIGGGGRVPLVVYPSGTTPGYQSTVPANHYSLLRTLEDAWGLPQLSQEANAAAMDDYFTPAAGGASTQGGGDATSTTVNVWLTTPDQANLLAAQTPLTFGSTASPDLPIVDVDATQQFQTMEGFGASFTDTSAWLMSQLDAATQSQVMTSLFDPSAGIGLSFLRQPIGSSDFALSLYTFDDIDPSGTDYSLSNFSIEHDRAYILPVLRAALAVNPGLQIMATPWSAPAWMKTSGTLTDGGNLIPGAFATYAQYFVDFLQAYAAEGVPVSSITVQNEPGTDTPYPSMPMPAADQATFIGQFLGPALGSAGLNQRIYTWDHNWDPQYALSVLGDSTANPYVAGAAFHCYLGEPDSMTTVRNAYPATDIAVTECSDGSRATFADKLLYDVRTMLIASTRNWASIITKWNVALDENRGPSLYSQSCVNCTGLVTISDSGSLVSFNEDYYALGHASKFVMPGAVRIASTTFGLGGIEDVAFQNPDGSIVVIAVNSADNPSPFQVRWNGATFQYSLDSGAVATFFWRP